MNDQPANEPQGEQLRAEIRRDIRRHLDEIGVAELDADVHASKRVIRKIQARSRRERAEKERWVLRDKGNDLIRHFACGCEIEPASIDPELEFIQQPDSEAGYLFRLASMIWSVPVSQGFGRRMRYLVRDRDNGKLIGIFAIGSPVFNLSARDTWIGWDVNDRRERLVSVMDAYVLGALPPYSRLLGGKLVGALATSAEVQTRFRERYGDRESVSGVVKDPQLVLMTTTSALGRSSVYNRLRLNGIVEFKRIGWTRGYGHFHIPEATFQKMRRLLEQEDHKYASGHSFGDGPNWRFRVVRKALELVGLDPDLLRHGIKREVFGVPLADDWRPYLCREKDQIDVIRPSATHIAKAAKKRWIEARAQRCPDYVKWTRRQTWELMTSRLDPPVQWSQDDDDSSVVSEPTATYAVRPPLPRKAEQEDGMHPHRESGRSPSPSRPTPQAA